MFVQGIRTLQEKVTQCIKCFCIVKLLFKALVLVYYLHVLQIHLLRFYRLIYQCTDTRNSTFLSFLSSWIISKRQMKQYFSSPSHQFNHLYTFSSVFCNPTAEDRRGHQYDVERTERLKLGLYLNDSFLINVKYKFIYLLRDRINIFKNVVTRTNFVKHDKKANIQ